jgi:hypothetical protein
MGQRVDRERNIVGVVLGGQAVAGQAGDPFDVPGVVGGMVDDRLIGAVGE